MKVTKRKDVFTSFSLAFKQAHISVYRNFVNSGKVQLADLLDALIEASYYNFFDAVKTKLLLEGKITNPQGGKLPAEKIKDGDLVTAEILNVMGRELMIHDPRHEYLLRMLKRERRTKPI